MGLFSFMWASTMLGLTLTLAAFQALLVIYPSYKTYKALESRSLQASQEMLLYWCITAFVGSLKEGVDTMFGSYANFFVWKLAVFALKAAPLIIGPERLYAMIVRPLFEAHESEVDAVVDEGRKVRSMAKESVVPALKEGDVPGAAAAAGDIVDVIRADAGELLATLTHSVADLSAKAAEQSEALGFKLDRRNAKKLLDSTMSQWESAREVGVAQAAQQWEAHGPLVKAKGAVLRQKGAELYATHAPVVKAKLMQTYQSQVQPRLQPAIDKSSELYNERVVPFVLARKEQAQQLWLQHGGAARSFYTNTWTPLYQDKIRPFVRDCLLPAVVETLIALKDRMIDFIRNPSDEVRSMRATHKARRHAAREGRKNASWKKRGASIKNKWQDAWNEVDQQASGSEQVAEPKVTEEAEPAPAATLSNRKSGHKRDSSIASAPTAPVSAPAPAEAAPASPTPIAAPKAGSEWSSKKTSELAAKLETETLPSKHSTSPPLQGGNKNEERGMDKEGQWATEPRSERIAEPIQ